MVYERIIFTLIFLPKTLGLIRTRTKLSMHPDRNSVNLDPEHTSRNLEALMTNSRTDLPFKLGAGEKVQLEASKLFLWYGQDFGHDERAVIGWLAANMPTDTQASTSTHRWALKR